jgi:hypothetical protein
MREDAAEALGRIGDAVSKTKRGVIDKKSTAVVVNFNSVDDLCNIVIRMWDKERPTFPDWCGTVAGNSLSAVLRCVGIVTWGGRKEGVFLF